MSCVGLLAIAAGAPHHSSPSTDNCHDDDHTLVQYAQPSRMIGGPLMMEAAEKVDKCLARLQSLQGTVSIPAPAVSATVSACISPAYSRSRSCIGSPKFEREEKDPVIRVHDILRFSDDFTGKFSTLPQGHRGKYLRRLSRSKTEVFDDKKDPRDPHGEWKHWSSGAGDVHKVVSEILMASQIAKEITSMVNACLVNTEVSSSEDEKPARRPNKYKLKLKVHATSSNKGTVTVMSNRMLRKEDPMHKFRVVTPSDSSKRRHNPGKRKEVLYPKSKLTADLIRSVDSMQEMSSTERKMQSRRSPQASVSPRASTEEPVLKSRSKAVVVPAESSKAAASVEDTVTKSQARVTGKSSRIAATPRAYMEEPVISMRVRLAGESSRIAATPRAYMEEPVISMRVRLAGESSRTAATPCVSIEEPVSRTHARVASEAERNLGTARARLEEPVLRNRETPRSSVEELLSKSKVRVVANAEPSRASGTLRPSDNDSVLKSIRSRVAVRESSSVLETPLTSVDEPILTRIRTHSAVKEPVLRNHARVAAESTRVAGTFHSSAEEFLSGNRYRVAVRAESSRGSGTPRASDNDRVLTRIRTRVAAPEASSAPGTPSTPVEDPVLTRFRARVAASAEPLRGSIEEPLSKLRPRAAAATPSKSATTSDMWEAKEITNCYNSPRAVGESSKKSAALPSSSTVKKVRNSRSPPLASQTSVDPKHSTSSVGAVPSSTMWRYNQSPSMPICFAPPGASQQPRLTNSPSRARIGRLPQENMAEGSSARIRRVQRESVQEPRIITSSISTSSTGFPAAVSKQSTFVAETNVESSIPEISFEPNNTLHRTSAREENASTTSNGSLKGGRNDDWFRKSLGATEISLGPSKLWKSGNNKAVLFSNPTFAPASPPGARPSHEKERSATPPVREPSPRRSNSATRRMKEWVGNVLHGRRSVSPDIAGRLGNSNRKLISLSPGRSLPSLITMLPSREKKASSSAPRASVFPSSAPKEAGELPLPPCRQAKQLAASKLTVVQVPPVRQVMELRAQKEKMDRQAHQLAAQKMMMVEDWNRTAEPPAPFEKDVDMADGPVWYSKRQMNDTGCNAKSYLQATECNSPMLDKTAVPLVRYSWEPEINFPMKKEEIANFKRGSGWGKKVGVIRVLSQRRSTAQEQPTVAVSKGIEKENVGGAVYRGGALRKSLSTGSQRSTSTIRAMSTGKMRTGPSFIKRAKYWMRTQTPFRDRPQKTTDLS